MKKKKTYVPPYLNCYVVRLQQMTAVSGYVGNRPYPGGGGNGDGFFDTGGVGHQSYGQDLDDSDGFYLDDEEFLD